MGSILRPLGNQPYLRVGGNCRSCHFWRSAYNSHSWGSTNSTNMCASRQKAPAIARCCQFWKTANNVNVYTPSWFTAHRTFLLQWAEGFCIAASRQRKAIEAGTQSEYCFSATFECSLHDNLLSFLKPYQTYRTLISQAFIRIVN